MIVASTAEGAWIERSFRRPDNWTRGVDLVGQRFNTVIGAVFLAIVSSRPEG